LQAGVLLAGKKEKKGGKENSIKKNNQETLIKSGGKKIPSGPEEGPALNLLQGGKGKEGAYPGEDSAS